MRVKAIQKMYYNRRDMLPGTEYDMDDRESSEANVLVALGKIAIIAGPQNNVGPKQRISQAPQPQQEQQPEEEQQNSPQRVMTTEESEPIVERPRTARYRRRDMRPIR